MVFLVKNVFLKFLKCVVELLLKMCFLIDCLNVCLIVFFNVLKDVFKGVVVKMYNNLFFNVFAIHDFQELVFNVFAIQAFSKNLFFNVFAIHVFPKTCFSMLLLVLEPRCPELLTAAAMYGRYPSPHRWPILQPGADMRTNHDKMHERF